jgi:hypothetical protein
MDEADRGRQPPACVPWRELPLTAALRVLILEDPPELTSDLIPIGNGSSAELTVAQTGVLWVFANDLVESLWQQHRRAAIDRYASRKPVRPVLGTRRGRAPRCRRCPGENATMIAQRSWCSVAVSAMVLSGCTQLHVTDCPDGQVLGKDVNRFRTASYRTTLDNPPAAAKRFLVLAAMSGLAYWHEGSECPHEDQHLTKQDADELKTILRGASPDGAWEPVRFDPALNLPTECRDDIGLFLNVWRRPGLHGHDDVVIAFRGTSNRPDWLYGNLWWFTRFFLSDDQYARSTRHVQAVLAHLDEQARLDGKRRPRVVATGHSLGGGLAQHSLYNFTEIRQAVVFAPSAVTGYVASRRGRAVLECDCDRELGTEARIIRRAPPSGPR